MRVGIVAGTALALLAGGSFHARAPLMVWNDSASSPRGLYLVVPGTARAGDTVVAWPPGGAAELAEARGYLPRGVPLVKTIVAGAGERVCAKRERISVNGREVAVRLRADRSGRALPWWPGCRRLEAEEFLLLGLDDPASFDGRYFGPVQGRQVIGRARLLWRA